MLFFYLYLILTVLILTRWLPKLKKSGGGRGGVLFYNYFLHLLRQSLGINWRISHCPAPKPILENLMNILANRKETSVTSAPKFVLGNLMNILANRKENQCYPSFKPILENLVNILAIRKENQCYPSFKPILDNLVNI